MKEKPSTLTNEKKENQSFPFTKKEKLKACAGESGHRSERKHRWGWRQLAWIGIIGLSLCRWKGIVRWFSRDYAARSRHGSAQIFIVDALFFSCDFDLVDFMFCFKKCNQVVHRLAKWAVVCDSNKVWLGSIPLWLEDVILADFLQIPIE